MYFYVFLCLCLTQERSVVLLATGNFVIFVPVEQMMNWGPPQPRTSLQPPTLHSLLVDDRSRPRCLSTPGQRNVCVRVYSDAWLCECFWAEVRGSSLHFVSQSPRGTSLLERLRRLSPQLQSIMGRKKIQIQRITDERNKQVSLSLSFFLLPKH